MPHPKVKISNDSGTTVGVTDNNELKVSIDDVNFSGDINVHLANLTDDVLIYGYDYSSANQKLKVDSAGLLYVKSIADTVTIDALDGGVLESTLDGVEVLLSNISTNSSNLSNINTKINTVAGAVDGSEMQVDIVSAPTLTINSPAVTNAGAFAVQETGATHDSAISATGSQIMGEAKIIDGSSLPNAVGEGDAGRFAMSRSGIMYTCLTDDAGYKSVVEIDDTSQETSPGMLNVGGEYRSTSTVYANGDATILQSDINGHLKVAITDHGITGGADGVTTVSSAGTDVVLGGDVPCKKIDIQAQTDNTGLIAVGFTGVDATIATGTGVGLSAGDSYSLEISNLNLIYIDSTVSGDGVRYTYFT